MWETVQQINSLHKKFKYTFVETVFHFLLDIALIEFTFDWNKIIFILKIQKHYVIAVSVYKVLFS